MRANQRAEGSRQRAAAKYSSLPTALCLLLRCLLLRQRQAVPLGVANGAVEDLGLGNQVPIRMLVDQASHLLGRRSLADLLIDKLVAGIGFMIDALRLAGGQLIAEGHAASP